MNYYACTACKQLPSMCTTLADCRAKAVVQFFLGKGFGSGAVVSVALTLWTVTTRILESVLAEKKKRACRVSANGNLGRVLNRLSLACLGRILIRTLRLSRKRIGDVSITSNSASFVEDYI